MSGQQPDDPAALVTAVREFLKVAAGVGGSGIGFQLLDSIPALRHLPWCPPWHHLMEFMRKQEVICKEIVWPVVVRNNSDEHNSQIVVTAPDQWF